MANFQELMMYLEDLGVLDVLVPFILIFTIVFAVLQKSQILGKNKKNFNVIVALAIALAVVIPHVTGSYPENADVVEIINNALPQISMIMVAAIAALLLIGVFAPKDAALPKSLQGLALILSFVATVIIFLHAAGYYQMPDWLGWLNDEETQSLIIVILVFGLIIWFITKEPKDQGDSNRKSFWESLEKYAPGSGGNNK
ncbi:hypothetical protein J7L02_00135 [Candidatus Woesearchaeota archaeon]|nr:hypothetical protein [Candidatus Woesearchaeota archaeon]